METDGYNRYLMENFGSDTSGGTQIAAYALHSVTTHQDARDITVSEAHYTLTNTLTETTAAEIRARKVLLGGNADRRSIYLPGGSGGSERRYVERSVGGICKK